MSSFANTFLPEGVEEKSFWSDMIRIPRALQGIVDQRGEDVFR
jgi:hypothetical protein